MLSQTAISERRACSLVGLNRATMRYQNQSRQETDLVQRIKAIAFERRRFVYRRVHQLLRREGLHVNHKKVYRLYREAGLAVRKRKRRKGLMVERQPLLLPDRPNHTWSMDFVMDALASKECLDIPIAHGISGELVARTLDTTAAFRGYPVAVRTDEGSEFTGKALDQWAYQHGVELKLIQSGKPMQNGYIKSFNGKFQDECLNEHWFSDLAHARELINQWRID